MITYTDKGALISDCGYYRYRLWRVWNPELPRVCFVMLNPSKGDATQDDNTIQKCVKLAKHWGFGGIEIVNLFALRATDPDELRVESRPTGSENDKHLMAAVTGATVGLVIVAWGNRGRMLDRDRAVLHKLLDHSVDVHAIKVNKDGSPAHPLYQSDTSGHECFEYPDDVLFGMPA